MTIGPSGPAGDAWVLQLPNRATTRTIGYQPAPVRPVRPAPVDKLTLQPVPAPVNRPEVPPIPVPRDRSTIGTAPVPRPTDGFVAAPLPPPEPPSGSTLTVPAGPLPRSRG
jgi:hypothetical protein